jgi:pre-mRNA cleavage complex 2 protein Pcf11
MQDWVNDFAASSEAGPSALPNADPKQPTKLTAERIAALQKKWVRVPTDTIKASQPCPICKEAFKGEWSEEEEEWVWKNAMEISNKVSA